MLAYTFTKPDTLVLRDIEKAYVLFKQKQDSVMRIVIRP